NERFDIDVDGLKYGVAAYVNYGLKALTTDIGPASRPKDESYRDYALTMYGAEEVEKMYNC
ncbi:MAG: hypothetical protein II977_07100, partial [Oscillospiraceae bacterium]|nr:hypothetical protein [Oscillospiraceae bacterium]